ncbi:phosphomannomutase/phosphoglucomutase [Gammaproteobacteria bacterium]|nr:phosphomannomutase/phosphoglucomutase [Gammaproteobacteria bacterium]
MIDQSIFREYDIRGTVPEQLNTPSIKIIAGAIAKKCALEKVTELALGRDGRLSGQEIMDVLSLELRKLSISIINVGLVTSPLLYFAAKKIDSQSGVMITGSHNPKNYNGFKVVINDAPVSGLELLKLVNKELSELSSPAKERHETNLLDNYIAEVCSQVSSTQTLKVVVDCGNGAAGEIAPKLMRALGHEVTELFCEIDGNFPNHHPDPGKPENLQDLILAVEENHADIGIAFDGDGDRLGVISNRGEIIFPDQLMMIFAKDVLAKNNGSEIIFDVKCSNLLAQVIEEAGGKAIMSATGHFHIKNALKKSGAPLAGEMSGHIFFNDQWYGFDDGHYSAFRLIDIITRLNTSLSSIFQELPKAFSTPEINIDVEEEKKFSIVQAFIKTSHFPGGEKITIDGLRINFNDGWGLLRASNTTPKLVLRFEAQTAERLSEIQELFFTQLQSIDESIQIELS